MNKFLPAIIIALLFVSCGKRNQAPFKVIYEVRSLSPTPSGIWISYNDSTGSYTQLYTTEKHWQKEVTLTTDQFAWLHVMTSSGAVPFKYRYSPLTDEKWRKRALVHGKIIHAQKTIEQYHSNSISITLYPLEIDTSI